MTDRSIGDIRKGIIDASSDYDIVLNVLNRLMPNADTDPYGSEEVIEIMRNNLYDLYGELSNRIKGGEI